MPGLPPPAAPVVHDHRLAEGFLQGKGDDARNDVGGATRWERHDQRDDALGIGGVGRSASERQCDCRQDARKHGPAARLPSAADHVGHIPSLPVRAVLFSGSLQDRPWSGVRGPKS